VYNVKRGLLVILAAGAVMAAGCSVALKGGVHAFESGEIAGARDRPTLSVWELEVGVYEFAEGKADLAVALGFPEGPDWTDFQDYRLTSRYHVSHESRFSPYLGGGIGWYRWFTAQDTTISPEYCSGLWLLYGCVLTDDVTLSSGYFPHVVAGFDIRLSSSVDFLIEGRHDFGKTDGDLDFASDQIVIGIRGRLNR
jgi:hypothetical protein